MNQKFQLISNLFMKNWGIVLLELYKILFIQKGILIIILLVVIQWNGIYKVSVYYSPYEVYLNKYYQELSKYKNLEFNFSLYIMGCFCFCFGVLHL